jgi:YidC/Oxa1 family membrane protein insertase
MSPSRAEAARGAGSASFIASWREYRRFRKLPFERRAIVFYSESRQDWHHFEPIIDRLTRELARTVCYVTSDAGDPGLVLRNERLLTFCIRKGLLRTLFFQVVESNVFVLTMMDLGNFELRRSLHPVHYVYLFHSLGSTHMADFGNSYDHYDTILCAGPHHEREIRRREALMNLPPKRLLAHGYHRLEELVAERSARSAISTDGPPTLLIAPTWGEQSLINICGERLVEILLAAGYRVILRPHYMTVRSSPELVAGIVRRFSANPRFEYVDRMGETESLFRSDLLVCDWSAMAIEWGLGLEKPALFIDVPPRERNLDWRELGLEPLEASIRTEIGALLDPARLDDAPGLVDKLLADPKRFRENAAALRNRVVFNPGRSAEVAAAEIDRLANEHTRAPRASQ